MRGHFRNCTIEVGECLCDFRRYWIVFVITLGILILEIIGGIISGSLALLADAGHVASDLIAILTAIAIAYLVYRRSDWEGGARSSGAYIHGVLLFAIALLVFLEALGRMENQNQIRSGTMMTIAFFGGAGNYLQHRILRAGRRTHVTQRGIEWHILSDLWQSVAVLLSGALILLTQKAAIDLVVSIAIATAMVFGGAKLITLGRKVSPHSH